MHHQPLHQTCCAVRLLLLIDMLDIGLAEGVVPCTALVLVAPESYHAPDTGRPRLAASHARVERCFLQAVVNHLTDDAAHRPSSCVHKKRHDIGDSQEVALMTSLHLEKPYHSSLVYIEVELSVAIIPQVVGHCLYAIASVRRWYCLRANIGDIDLGHHSFKALHHHRMP